MKSHTKSLQTEYIEEPISAARQPEHKELQWTLPERCGSSIRGRVDAGNSWTFDPTADFGVHQTSDNNFKNPNVTLAHVFGDLILRPTTSIFPTGYVLVESISNTENMGVSVNFGFRSNAIMIEANRGTLSPDNFDPCLQMRITVFVPPGVRVQSLTVQTDYLNLKIEEGFSMTVANVADFVAYEGNISTPNRTQGELSAPYRLSAPAITATSYKGRLSGWYPVYNTLRISAGWKVDVSSSQKGLKSGPPRAARVIVESDFDDVQIQQLALPRPKNAIPRDHSVNLKTGSGDIRADLLHASRVAVEATAGNVNMTMTTPPGDGCRSWGHKVCSVLTATTDGNQHLVIKRPPSDHQKEDAEASAAEDAPVIPWLQSEHRALAGDIVAHYPSSWEGSLQGVTISGNMSYSGEGLTTRTVEAVGLTLRGKKGNNKSSSIVVRTISGNQRVSIGS